MARTVLNAGGVEAVAVAKANAKAAAKKAAREAAKPRRSSRLKAKTEKVKACIRIHIMIESRAVSIRLLEDFYQLGSTLVRVAAASRNKSRIFSYFARAESIL